SIASGGIVALATSVLCAAGLTKRSAFNVWPAQTSTVCRKLPTMMATLAIIATAVARDIVRMEMREGADDRLRAAIWPSIPATAAKGLSTMAVKMDSRRGMRRENPIITSNAAA